jgi:cAMP-binding proteins - catabolite gene activator and regulatory subunit of cAMP-dependent protein kinases
MSLDFPKADAILQTPVFPDYRYKGLRRKPRPLTENYAYSEIGNDILKNLSTDAFLEIEPFLQHVNIKKGQTIFGIGDAIDSVYFPNDCVASRIALTEDGATVEVGMIGREGVWGVRALFGAADANYQTVAETSGSALKISALTLKMLAERNPELQSSLVKFYESLLRQVSQRAVCRCRHTIRQQLSAWLLEFMEKARTNKLCITQEKIAQRLGTRRASVTVAVSELQAKEIVRCERGCVIILDPSALEVHACECLRTED